MKKASIQPAAAPAVTPLLRILKTATCPNLSDSAKLGYHIGCNAESQILLRVHSNSGSGYFSKEWVSLDAVLKALDKCPKDKPLTAFWLHTLFVGKSINTPSFLMAVLLAEGLVKKVERNYERCDHKEFVSEMNKLIDSGAGVKIDAEPKAKPKAEAAPTIKKTARKVPPAARVKA
jgi:hypothetical protein